MRTDSWYQRSVVVYPTLADGREASPPWYAPVPPIEEAELGSVRRAYREQGDTWPLMSFYAYGTTMHWKTLAAVNRVVDPFTEGSIGDVVLVPPVQDVAYVLSRVADP